MSQSNFKESIRLDAWRGVLQKTNRILTGEPVTVNLVPGNQIPGGLEEVPGWTDGINISLNSQVLKETLTKTDPTTAVLRLKGLNYHELCHVLYTPRQNDELPRQILKRAEQDGNYMLWMHAFNALEDQRIETWFASKYWVSRRYFEATVLEYIIRNGSTELAVLVYGRKYLSPKIRVQAGKVFKKKYGKALYDEFKTVIDEYVTLALPADSIKAMRLITRYKELLTDMQKANGNQPLPVLIIGDNGMMGPNQNGPVSHGDPTVVRTGKPMPGSGNKTARALAEEMIEDAMDADAAEEAAQEASEKNGGGKEAADTKGEGSGQGDSGQDGNSNEKSGQSSDTEATGSGGGGASKDGAPPVKDPNKSLAEEMSDLVDQAHDDMADVREDETVQNDVEQVLDSVKAVENNGKLDALGEADIRGYRVPGDKVNLATRKVHDVLSRIRQDAEPETLFRQNHGRLDPRRWMRRKPHEMDVYRTWAPGNEEETEVEACVICDVSGSMGHRISDASDALYALKRAFDKLDIRTTVLAFGSGHTVVYQPGEKARPNKVPVLSTAGGTDPTTALEQVNRILAKSQSPNKVLITITDGQWNGGTEWDKTVYGPRMKSIHKTGAVSLLLGLDGAKRTYGKHHHTEGHDISSVTELPIAATKLVSALMRKATS